MKTTRRYDIDWLRVIAIGLLLTYHIAIIFQPWAMFIGFIRSEELWEGLWKPMTALNIWRIPLLFCVSGMGCYFAMRKRNWKQLVLERSKRILLPFLFGIVAITPLHMYVFQAYYNMPSGYFPHWGHLWFLANIFAYVLLLLPLFYLLKKHAHGRFQRGLSQLMAYPFGPLLFALPWCLEAFLVKPQIYALYAQTWHGFFLGCCAFLSGYLMVYSGASFWKTAAKWRWAYLGLAMALYTLRYQYFALESPSLLSALESISWILAVLGFGHHYLNRPSRALAYLTKAAYPVYIIHMVVLYLGAWLILPMTMGAFLKYLLITVFTFVGCFLIYEFILRRIAILRPFFGLNWSKEKHRATKDIPQRKAVFPSE